MPEIQNDVIEVIICQKELKVPITIRNFENNTLTWMYGISHTKSFAQIMSPFPKPT